VKVRPIQSSFRSFSLNKKAHVLEKGAKGPIFEGNMLPQKIYPQNWRQYWRHNRNPVKEKVKVNLMKRNKLKLTLEWDDFLKSEWKQMDRYEKVGMFGDPVKANQWMTILPWV
jgi:hypothetical protein